MINEKKKKKRRLLWLLLIFFLLAGSAIVAGFMPKSPVVPLKQSEPEINLEQKKREAKQVINEVFCYCSPEDISHYQEIAQQQAQKSGHARQMGGIDCMGGYYDAVQDIAYISGIYGKGNFYDIPPYDYRKCFKYYYRDFYLQNSIHRFDFYSLDKPELYNQPIVFRIYRPKIYNDVSDTSYYENQSGKEGYKFIKYNDVYCTIGYYDRESTSKSALMVDQPTNFDDYGKIPFEEYAEIIGVDLAKVVFVDIK